MECLRGSLHNACRIFDLFRAETSAEEEEEDECMGNMFVTGGANKGGTYAKRRNNSSRFSDVVVGVS